MGKKCIVTGGAGFIGSHVVETLLARGHEVVALDNLATGRTANFDSYKDHSKFRFVQKDVANDCLAQIFDGVDWVFHLAGLADIVPSIEKPNDYHEANVQGTLKVLEASRSGSVKRFVYAASSSCYGIPENFPTSESCDIKPMYPYALTKYMGEQYVMHWNQIYDLPCVSLRLFNVYGPRSRTTGAYGAVFGVFMAQKLAGKPYTVVGDGKQTRDFTYVTDVAEAFVKAAESDLRGEVMNVGSGGTYSVNRLVELLGGPVEYIPKRPGEPDCTFADVSKIEDKLKWAAQISFEEGVARMLACSALWKDAPVWDATSIAQETKAWFEALSEPEIQGQAG